MKNKFILLLLFLSAFNQTKPFLFNFFGPEKLNPQSIPVPEWLMEDSPATFDTILFNLDKLQGQERAISIIRFFTGKRFNRICTWRI